MLFSIEVVDSSASSRPGRPPRIKLNGHHIVGKSKHAGELRLSGDGWQDVELILLERGPFQIEVVCVGSHDKAKQDKAKIDGQELVPGSSMPWSKDQKLTIGTLSLQFFASNPSPGFLGNFVVRCDECDRTIERMEHVINADASWSCDRHSDETLGRAPIGGFIPSKTISGEEENTTWDILKAIQPVTGLLAALKLPKHPGNKEMLREYIKREESIAQQLRHPRLAAHYGAGESQSLPFAIIEYMSAGSIFDYMNAARLKRPNTPPLGLEDILVISQDMFVGLDYLHELGVVHRDIYPGSILLRRRDGWLRAKLSKFGMAKGVADSGPTWENRTANTQMERQWLFSSRDPFLSPSRRAKEPATFADDIYGAGIVMYWMLTGETPQQYAGPTTKGRYMDDVQQRLRENKHRSVEIKSAHLGVLPTDLVELVNGLTEPLNEMRKKVGITRHVIDVLGWLRETARRTGSRK